MSGGETPGERTVRLVSEDAELRASLARNLYEHETGDTDWEDMPAFERGQWEDRAVAAVRSFCSLDPALHEALNAQALRETLARNDARFDSGEVGQ